YDTVAALRHYAGEESLTRRSAVFLCILLNKIKELLPVFNQRVKKECCNYIHHGGIIIPIYSTAARRPKGVRQLIRAGIVGASGYTGGELIRLLHAHPEVELTAISSRTFSGKQAGEVFGSLTGSGYKFEDLSPEEIVARTDVIFVAAPHGVAMEYAPIAYAAGKKMIDLGPDFRFRDASLYEQWYKIPHSCPQL